MANQLSPAAPTIASANFKGTLAGAIATMAVGVISKAGYLTLAASIIGVPEATLSILAMAVLGGAANFLVTHFAALKTLNTVYDIIPEIHTYAEYPQTPMEKLMAESMATTNLKTKDGQNVE